MTESATGSGVPPTSTISIDTLSKATAIALVFLYVSGFLISSLHGFKYGFSEINPLRPRILAAGGWFAIFLAIPFALVWELRKHSALKDKSNKLSKLAALLPAYVGSALFLFAVCWWLFTFDTAQPPAASTRPPLHWWQVALFLLSPILTWLLYMIAWFFVDTKLPKWVKPTLIILFYGYIAVWAYYDVFGKNSFTITAPFLWVLIAGGFFYLELSSRNWILHAGRWEGTIVFLLMLLTMFATVYYPHIKAKWGGGALVPVELTFLKNQTVPVACDLIDETDAGFYVIGKGEPSATFIPRTEISAIYYGQRSKPSVFAVGPPGAKP